MLPDSQGRHFVHSASSFPPPPAVADIPSWKMSVTEVGGGKGSGGVESDGRRRCWGGERIAEWTKQRKEEKVVMERETDNATANRKKRQLMRVEEAPW